MLDLDHQNQWREVYRASHPGWQPATELYYATVTELLLPGVRVLDLGCGRGGLVEQLPPPSPWIVGVDPDRQSLIEHRVTALPRVAAMSDNLPFANGSFELVVASWVLEHLERPRETMTEITRVLSANGRFVFITPNGRHPLTMANRLFGRAGHLQKRLVDRAYGRAEGDTFPTRYQANSPADIKGLASASGLRLVSLTPVADPSYVAFTPALFKMMTRFDDRLSPERRIHLVGVLAK